MIRRLLLFLSNTTLLAAAPSLILHGGKIVTVDQDFRMVSAMAFEDPTVFALEDEVCIEHKPGSYALAGDRPRLTTEELWAQVPDAEA
jgi:hypothetical protein